MFPWKNLIARPFPKKVKIWIKIAPFQGLFPGPLFVVFLKKLKINPLRRIVEEVILPGTKVMINAQTKKALSLNKRKSFLIT